MTEVHLRPTVGSLTRVYGDMLDGLRSYYEAREGLQPRPAFSAVALLCALASANFAAALLAVAAIEDERLNGRAKLVILVAGVIVGVVHTSWARRAGFFLRTGPARNPSWRLTFWSYLAMTALFVLVAGTAYVYRLRE